MYETHHRCIESVKVFWIKLFFKQTVLVCLFLRDRFQRENKELTMFKKRFEDLSDFQKKIKSI